VTGQITIDFGGV